MVRASFWQWSRHNEKLELRSTLEQRIALPPEPYNVIDTSNPILDEYKRVTISGEYDFANEIVLRNRRYKSVAGVFIITPLAFENNSKHILVNRGFIPLKDSEIPNRVQFQSPKKDSFTGLLKKSLERTFFLAPLDPPNVPSRLDAWLRVDISRIQDQIPYHLEPLWVEKIADDNSFAALTELPLSTVKTQTIMSDTKSEKDEILSLANRGAIAPVEDLSNYHFPIPQFDAVIPAGRHLGYVYEWAIMAFFTVLIGIILQFDRRGRTPRCASPNNASAP